MRFLSPTVMARLERLRLLSRRSAARGSAGERRSVAQGSSAEFVDHRDYMLGDDPRSIDWNAYARLDKLFVKLFMQESEIPVHLIVDASASMGFGSPSKFESAGRLAASLAFVALANLDRASLRVLGGSAPADLPSGRGRAWLGRIIGALEKAGAGGRFDPANELHRHAAGARRRGLAIVVSDFLDPAYPEALKPLLARRHEVWCLQVLSAEDLGEGLSGDVRLVDSETGAARDVTVSTETLAAYRAGVQRFQAGLLRWCLDHGVGFAGMRSDEDVEGALLGVLRRRRLLG